jgi:hypothetical protein
MRNNHSNSEIWKYKSKTKMMMSKMAMSLLLLLLPPSLPLHSP